MNFDKAYSLGRRIRFYGRLFRRDTSLLSIDDVVNVVRPQGESYSGIEDIKVERIIGSESRSSDFVKGFLPIQKWMRSRWSKLQKLILVDGINSTIMVYEYGGYYFVRDGNHRVSVAKTNRVEFISAEVTLLSIPVELCPNMRIEKLPLFREKYDFFMKTKIFTIIPEDKFYVARMETWAKIEDSIFTGHKKWFIDKNGYEPDDETLIHSWNIEIYENTMDHIKKHYLLDLVPGKRETDIFCDIMDMWADRPGVWFTDVYDAYLKKYRKRNIIRTFFNYIKLALHLLTRTRREERTSFLQVSRLLFFRPDAVVPRGTAHWYRFLTKQLMGSHFKYLSIKLKRNPHMDELTKSWYDELFKPALDMYEKHGIKEPFSRFYRGWMNEWQKKLHRKKHASLEIAFKSYTKKRKIWNEIKGVKLHKSKKNK
ncbi:MAG: hypothetical protein KAS64_04415 [Spirochaetes bacterium]|nr:hypothetical protein [Spirochaetota bacterium]